MNSVSFDVYSDFQGHLWNDQMPDFAAIKKNSVAVVAGDLHRDPKIAAEILRKMADVYTTVLFVDGNAEYGGPYLAGMVSDMAQSRKLMNDAVKDIDNVVYLNNGPCVINGVGFVGRAALYDHKCSPEITQEQAVREQAALFHDYFKKNATNPEARAQIEKQGAYVASVKPISMQEAEAAARTMVRQARVDAAEMQNEIDMLDKSDLVHTIVAVTHTVPHPDLIKTRETDTPWRKSVAANTDIYALKGEKLKYGVSGHLIDNDGEKIRVIGDRTYIVNPMGGPRDGLHLSPADYRPVSVEISAPPQLAPGVRPENAPAP